MARAWRIEYEGAYYHVLSRGNEGQNIFRDDKDREQFLELLGEISDRFNVEIHGYVLMDNHYHLLLRTLQANLSKCMQWFGSTYTRRFNLKYGRKGHLFQGRFKNIVIENESYLMQLSCYIHRNPLRAGMVSRIAEYKWSSYLAYAYKRNCETWLKTGVILNQFKGESIKEHVRYREKVQKYSKEEKKVWEDFKHGLFYGTETFVSEMKENFLPGEHHSEKPQQKAVRRPNDVHEQLKKISKTIGIDLSDYRGNTRLSGSMKIQRDLLMNLLWETGMFKNEEIGEIFGISYSAVSKCVKSIRQLIFHDKDIKRQFKVLNSLFKM